MTRMIDASELLFEIQVDSWDSERDKDMAEDLVLGMPTLTLPNEPLTEEQFQEMVGHPVWIKSARRKEWMLLWGCHGPEIYGRSFIFTRRTAQKEQFQFSELGVTWWPYRRPPGGEEET